MQVGGCSVEKVRVAQACEFYVAAEVGDVEIRCYDWLRFFAWFKLELIALKLQTS